jgi:hypothetical protein
MGSPKKRPASLAGFLLLQFAAEYSNGSFAE